MGGNILTRAARILDTVLTSLRRGLRIYPVQELNIRSTRVNRCPFCGVRITPANDSGWEWFVTGTYTQPTCRLCDAKKQAELEGLCSKVED